MTYGNMSWHEYGQIGVDAARKLNENERDKAIEWAREENSKLKEKLKESEQVNQVLKARAEKSSQEADAYKSLLSRPMQEIAQVNGDFKKAYDDQQELLATWIMGQKAYKETAEQLGLQLNKTPEEVTELARKNVVSVLENKTLHGNDASESPTLNNYAEKILEIRKKKGLC